MRIGQTSLLHLFARGLMTIAGFLGNIYFVRELGASVLGQYFLIISSVIWISIGVKMGIPAAVTQRISARPEASDRFISTGAVMQFLLFLGTSVLILIFAPYLKSYLGIGYVYVFPLIILVRVGFGYINQVLRGQHKVHIESLLIPTDWISRVLLQAGLVYYGWKLVGMLTGYIVGATVAIAIGLYFVTYSPAKPTRETFRSLLDFSRYSWIGGIKSRAFHSLDTIVLGIFVLPSFIAIYEIAWNISSVFGIFGDSISQTMFPELSEAAAEGSHNRVTRYLNNALAFAGIFAIPGLMGAFIVGDRVLAIYSQEFVKGQEVLFILTVAGLFNVYESQFTSALKALDRPDKAFRIQVVYIGTNAVLNLGLVYLYGWIGAAVATTTAAVLGLILGYRGLADIIPVSLPLREIGKQVAAAAIMGVVTVAVRDALDTSLLSLAVIIGCGAAVYFAVLFGISRRFRDVVFENVPFSLPRA